MTDDYESLIRPIEQHMIRSVWRILRDADDADDAMQSALETVWKRLPRIRSHPNPHALILRICANAAYDQLRRKKRRGEISDADVHLERTTDDSPSALDMLHRKGQLAELFAAIGRLSRSQAVAILMRFIQEQSYAAIAEALGCGENTARVHVNRGRKRLHLLLPHLASEYGEEVSP